MTATLSNKHLLSFLKSHDYHVNFIDRLKVYYRPMVCPFVDLIGLVKPGEKVGDIGCGSGQFCLLLARFAKPSYLFGIEISDKLIDNARQLFKGHEPNLYTFEKYDGQTFPDAIGELDIVFLNDVLHHVPKQHQQTFVADLIKKMKPGARLVLKDIDGASPFVYFNKLHDLVFAGEIGNERSFATAQQWLQQNGLRITMATKKRMYVYAHYTIVAIKES
ncbi:class I SAM-dependent methyltransferase [Deminuibacter soli]|uniref:Class I SAM-dependent methyltransferase n=1 Tax=Deminuibacter soli TaxID=2291815 RepID=A0A3E1NQD4_9BACT|nr:class I SAM-dependent methyltransferase [Deminuibacter soli]RFM30169.1 class I SAM-dependent methyltransferase [Deminuibacter soli]